MTHLNRLLLSALLALSLYSALCDDLLFAIEYSSPALRYPKLDLFDWAKGKSLFLTNGGMRQQYLLGREIRKLLIEDTQLLLDRYVERQQILVRTVAKPEAITSAYAQLMGLYIPGSGDLLTAREKETAYPPNKFDYSPWTQELESAALNYTYQAVPIIESGGVPDYLLNSEEACGGVKSMLAYASSDNWGRQSIYKALYEKLAQAFGLPSDSVYNVTFATELRYALMLSVAEGHSILEDDTKSMELHALTKDIEIADLYDFTLDVAYDDRNVSKIIATPFLVEALKLLDTAKTNHMQNQTNKNPLRFALYIGTTHLLEAVLQRLNLNSGKKLAPPSSMLLFELYKNESSNNQSDIDYYVRVTYNQEAKNDAIFPDFAELISKNTYDDKTYKAYCASYSKEEVSESFNWTILIIVVGSILAIALIGILIFYLRLKCKGTTDDAEEEEQVLKTLKGQLGVKD